jgi:hypothetical protein
LTVDRDRRRGGVEIDVAPIETRNLPAPKPAVDRGESDRDFELRIDEPNMEEELRDLLRRRPRALRGVLIIGDPTFGERVGPDLAFADRLPNRGDEHPLDALEGPARERAPVRMILRPPSAAPFEERVVVAEVARFELSKRFGRDRPRRDARLASRPLGTTVDVALRVGAVAVGHVLGDRRRMSLDPRREVDAERRPRVGPAAADPVAERELGFEHRPEGPDRAALARIRIGDLRGECPVRARRDRPEPVDPLPTPCHASSSVLRR